MDKIKLDGSKLSKDIEELLRALGEELTKRYNNERVELFLNHLEDLCQMRKNIPISKNRLDYHDTIQVMLDTFKKTKKYLNHFANGKTWFPLPERIWDYDNEKWRKLLVLESNALEQASQIPIEPIEALIEILENIPKEKKRSPGRPMADDTGFVTSIKVAFYLILNDRPPTSYEDGPFAFVIRETLKTLDLPGKIDPSRAIKQALKDNIY